MSSQLSNIVIGILLFMIQLALVYCTSFLLSADFWHAMIVFTALEAAIVKVKVIIA